MDFSQIFIFSGKITLSEKKLSDLEQGLIKKKGDCTESIIILKNNM